MARRQKIKSDGQSSVATVRTYLISVGSRTEAIMHQYEVKRRRITSFNPDYIIFHTGHNDLAFHRTKNPTPKDPTQVTKLTIDAATVLQNNHPHAVIVISAPFPRTFTHNSTLLLKDILHYNGTAMQQDILVGVRPPNHTSLSS